MAQTLGRLAPPMTGAVVAAAPPETPRLCITGEAHTIETAAESWSTPAVGWAMEPRRAILVSANRSGDVMAYAGASLSVLWCHNLDTVITASPTIDDVNGDGQPEVVIGTEAGEIVVFRLCDGRIIWRVRCGKVVRATAAIVQFPDERGARIYVTGYGTWLFCLDGTTGIALWRRYLPKHEFYRSSKEGAVSSPLVADVDLDGELEVVVGTRSRRLFCLSAITGAMKWFREFSYDPDSSPSFAVVEGVPMVFFGGGEHTSGIGDNALFALRGSDGATLWRAAGHGGMDSSPTIADLNNDGRLEVVCTSLADASCYAFDAATGKRLWRHRFGPTPSCRHDLDNICRPRDSGIYFTEHAICRSYTSPLVVDLDADGNLEVVVGSNNREWVVLDGASGRVRYGEKTRGPVRGSAILVDLNGDGTRRLVITSGRCLQVYPTAAVAGDWPMFKGTADHVGYIGTPLPSTNGVHRLLPQQRFRRLRLLWCWLVVDACRFILFHIERRLLRRFKISLRPYYY